MPERLDRVSVSLDGPNVTISWDARQALMKRLYDANIKPGVLTFGASSKGILRAFSAVGATRPIELTKAQRRLLRDVLAKWAENDPWFLDTDDRMPAELIVLHDALASDVQDAKFGSAAPDTDDY